LIARLSVLVGYVALSLAGLYLMKKAAEIMSPTFACGFGMYVAGFGVWMVLLRMYPLSLAFPLAAGSLIVGTQLVGWLMLGEDMTPHRAAGVALILGGIALLALFDRANT
jgi:multidrug transporter EmrE-like cation transporter